MSHGLLLEHGMQSMAGHVSFPRKFFTEKSTENLSRCEQKPLERQAKAIFKSSPPTGGALTNGNDMCCGSVHSMREHSRGRRRKACRGAGTSFRLLPFTAPQAGKGFQLPYWPIEIGRLHGPISGRSRSGLSSLQRSGPLGTRHASAKGWQPACPAPSFARRLALSPAVSH